MAKYPIIGNVSKEDIPYLFISLIPIWWILGIDFIVFHILSLFYLFLRLSVFKINDYFQLCLMLIILFLLISLITSNVRLDRWFASLNNISILFVGYFYYSYTKNYLYRNPIYNNRRFFKYFFILSILYICTAILSAFLYYFGFQEITFSTFFGLLPINLPGLLGQYQEITLFKPNWFLNTNVPRLFIFHLYATGSALIIGIAGLIGLNFIPQNQPKLRLIFLTFIFASLFFTLSRTSLFAFIISCSLLVLFYLGKFLSFYVLLLLISFGLLFISSFNDMFIALLDARENSTSARLFVYKLSLDFIMEHDFLFGVGFKPRLDDFFIPLGSHSTYISLFVRGGLVCLFLFSFMVCIVMLKSFRALFRLIFLKSNLTLNNFYFMFAIPPVICSLAFITLQDIDAYPPVCVIIMCSLAYFSYSEKQFYLGKLN